MSDLVSEELFSYAVRCRRYLHENPEVGFELPNTASFVRDELIKMGLAPTDRYGSCSVCAELGPAGEGVPVLALRADMDALPIQEKTGLPYASKHSGRMHACGHDAHTAILLSVAKLLKEREGELPCRVRLIFQPNEEGAVSGAKMLVDNGVMDGVDVIICTHCENGLETGRIGICSGDYMAACAPVTLRFMGKSSHATLPEGGVDAIAMAHEAYGRLGKMVEQQAGSKPYIWSVGTFRGGQAHNVIADRCEMDISFRFYDYALCEAVHQGMLTVSREIAERFGGSFQLDWHVSTGAVHNDEKLTAAFSKCLTENGFILESMERRMSSEDFGWYLTKKPGMLFRFGTRNEALGCTGVAHQNDFTIDEAGMKTAIQAFVCFVMNTHKYFESI